MLLSVLIEQYARGYNHRERKQQWNNSKHDSASNFYNCEILRRWELVVWDLHGTNQFLCILNSVCYKLSLK